MLQNGAETNYLDSEMAGNSNNKSLVKLSGVFVVVAVCFIKLFHALF